jgi:hypothetical protein
MASEGTEAIQSSASDGVASWLGLPTLGELKGIQVLTGSEDVTPVPRLPEPARGGDDVESIIYIQFIPDLPEEAEAQLKRLQDATEVTMQYFSVKAGEAAQLKIKEKQLPDDMSIGSQLKRSVYRAKVVEHVMSLSSW